MSYHQSNDIPLKLENYPNLSALLYADDLFNFFSDINLNRIKIVLQKYLNSLESWLKKWRLKVAPHKCSYNIYNKSGMSKKSLDLSIFGQKIVRDNNPRYLGIYLDPKLSFNFHITKLKEKCFRKYNFLKILKSKKCKNKTKITVYNALIRSNMDFGGPLFTKINESNKKKLRAIQLGIQTLDDHFLTLKKRFVSKSLLKNPMIIELKDELENYKTNRVIQENFEDISLF